MELGLENGTGSLCLDHMDGKILLRFDLGFNFFKKIYFYMKTSILDRTCHEC